MVSDEHCEGECFGLKMLECKNGKSAACLSLEHEKTGMLVLLCVGIVLSLCPKKTSPVLV